MSEFVLYSVADQIATVTLNRPEKFNTLRPELLAQLGEALAKANRDSAVKVIVLEGAGDSFCGGFDFSDG
ncbi:MAG: enoyl-CoA hydratase-related protein, partial [Acidobacteriota bacterium]